MRKPDGTDVDVVLGKFVKGESDEMHALRISHSCIADATTQDAAGRDQVDMKRYGALELSWCAAADLCFLGMQCVVWPALLPDKPATFFFIARVFPSGSQSTADPFSLPLYTRRNWCMRD